MPTNFLIRLLNAVLPPRATERAIEALTHDSLFALQDADGLPYSNESVRALVWELKYHASRRAAALAGGLLAEELLAIAGEELGRPLLIPVPMHRARRRERGHNQTELLCRAALKAMGAADFSAKTVWLRQSRPEDFFAGESAASDTVFDYAPDALVRTRPTPEQQKLSRTQRLINLKNSMQANRNIVAHRACVVIDDVKTTGATLNEAARALKEAGASRVHTIALAQS